MYTYSTITDRKLSVCKGEDGQQIGSDRYLEILGVDHFEEIWHNLDEGIIQTINGENVTRQRDMFKFKIIDTFSKKKFNANIMLNGNRNSMRLRLGSYSDEISMVPEQIITIGTRMRTHSDCILTVKAEWLYAYIFKKHTDSGKYFLTSQSCTNIIGNLHFQNFISQFGIYPNHNNITVGRDRQEYHAYHIEGCTSTYVGVPFSTELPLDCFEADEIKDRV